MDKRKLLYMKPAHREAPLCEDIRAAGWEVRTVDQCEDARRMVASRQYHVGLALFDQPGDWTWLDGRMLNPGAAMEWVALLTPAAMRQAVVGRRIRNNFFDYHTLPADKQRLLLTLGHAYGMATLLGTSMPLPAGRPRVVLSLHKARQAAEQAAIEMALRRTQNNMTRAAQELGISRVTLYRLLEKNRDFDGA